MRRCTSRGCEMIELVPSEYEDAAFLSLAQRIVNGAVAALQVREVYLVQTDNWFDHKWLGWRSRWKERQLKELCVPTFTPNRIISEKHFRYDANRSRWNPAAHDKPLHVLRSWRTSNRMPLDRLAKSAAFIWYSGNTVTNKAGSLMLYLSGAEGYAWYASFRKADNWKVEDEFRITRRELLSFEECGRNMEPART
jgi:hypothetical protein